MRSIHADQAIETLSTYARDSDGERRKFEHTAQDLRQADTILEITLQDVEALHSLIWHDIDATERLTKGYDRRLGAVVARLHDYDMTFDELARASGFAATLVKEQKARLFFRQCAEIEQRFDWDRFSPPLLVMPNQSEQVGAQNRGTYYIHNGNHRTLVVASMLLQRRIEFRPITCWLLLPRPR